uniref:Uncharacterized protein n=1 Tax=Candidatus Kentrum sp. FW TaxID=2126338 RepID=A0A450STM9_9GAMM|nr:MAG: hypothetical protein BECKFW1821B_GA0114236_103312 [Candidatus Kentron sp. FW]
MKPAKNIFLILFLLLIGSYSTIIPFAYAQKQKPAMSSPPLHKAPVSHTNPTNIKPISSNRFETQSAGFRPHTAPVSHANPSTPSPTQPLRINSPTNPSGNNIPIRSAAGSPSHSPSGRVNPLLKSTAPNRQTRPTMTAPGSFHIYDDE